jgi:cytochrome P450
MTSEWIGASTWGDTIGPAGQDCPHINAYAQEFMSDFDRIIDDARAKCPVAWDEAERRFMALGGDVLFEAAQDWRTFSSAYGVGGPQFPKLLPMDSDEPEHREWRRPLNPLFTVGVHDAQRPGIAAIAHSLIDSFVDAGRAEAISSFCRPLPGQVFFKLIIDLPESDLDYLQELVESVVDPRDPAAQRNANAELDRYVADVVAARRSMEPTDDLIGRVVFTKVDGKLAPAEDAQSALVMIIQGGLETTTNTLAGALAHLASDVDLQTRLRSDRTLLRPAVEEFLRLYSPTTSLTRYVTTDTELAGISMRKGQRLGLSFAAANRDPAIFAEPKTFRLDREHNRHYAFGVGIHRCLGSNLARTMMQESLTAVLDRLPTFTLAPGFTPQYRYAGIRGLESVEIVF